MEKLQGYLDKMGSNFIVSAFIPSLGFVTILMLSLQPVLPPDIVDRLGGTFNPLGQSALVTLVLAIILGFTLSTLSTYIYKLYEGYVSSNWFKRARRSEVNRVHRLDAEIRRLDRKIARVQVLMELPANQNRDEIIDRLKALRDARFNLEADKQNNFPPSDKYILPTRFGNILRAAESYSRVRYGIDGVPMWPRLALVIPDQYMARVDMANNQCSFLLNSSILSVVYGLLCLLVSGYQLFICILAAQGISFWLYFIPINLHPAVYFQRIGIYFVIAIFSFLIAMFFYKASLFNLNRYGLIIRSAYDLFRFDLLRALKFPLPETTEDEYQEWEDICQFINVGYQRGQEELAPLTYTFEQDQEPYVGNLVGYRVFARETEKREQSE